MHKQQTTKSAEGAHKNMAYQSSYKINNFSLNARNEIDRLEAQVIPLPISQAISADRGFTCLTTDRFRGHRRRWIKRLRLPMGSAGGDVGNGMGSSRAVLGKSHFC